MTRTKNVIAGMILTAVTSAAAGTIAGTAISVSAQEKSQDKKAGIPVQISPDQFAVLHAQLSLIHQDLIVLAHGLIGSPHP